MDRSNSILVVLIAGIGDIIGAVPLKNGRPLGPAVEGGIEQNLRTIYRSGAAHGIPDNTGSAGMGITRRAIGSAAVFISTGWKC